MQLTVRASDMGVPPRTADVSVSMTVTTDQNLPTFIQNEYNADLRENERVGTEVARVNANDLDVSVLVYFIQYCLMLYLSLL